MRGLLCIYSLDLGIAMKVLLGDVPSYCLYEGIPWSRTLVEIELEFCLFFNIFFLIRPFSLLFLLYASVSRFFFSKRQVLRSIF